MRFHRAPSRKIIDTVSHAGERIVKANRSVRAQELSAVRRTNVNIVPAPAQKYNRCVSAKRGKHSPPRPREPHTRGQSATCRGVKYVSSRGISGDFRNPTALVRVFSSSRGNLKTLPSRGIFMSRSRGIFMSPSRGVSGDFRNPTDLVRVFSSSRGNLKRLPSRGIFMSPSRGISGDFRNLTALVRVLIPPEGI